MKDQAKHARTSKFLTAEEIRSLYSTKPRESLSSSYETSPQQAQSQLLTPAARHVVGQARKRLGTHSAVAGSMNSAQLKEEDLYSLVSTIEQTEGEELSNIEKTAAVAALSASLENFDILTPLLENTEINDIVVRTWNDISIQVGRRNVQTDLQFPNPESYKSFVENLLRRAGKACSTACPVVDVAIDPRIRACVSHESFSPRGSGPMLTLRISRHTSATLEMLCRNELAPLLVLDYIAGLVSEARGTVLIAGEVATGKTTLVKALSLRMPEDEAILIIEDTHELAIPRRFVRTLLTRESNSEGYGRISPAQAIRTGMRMAMNRIILGEMRDAEAAEAFIDVAASGHPGMSTIHARSARDAIARMELFLSRAQPGVGFDAIRRQIANSLALVVYLAVDRESGKRRIYEVIEVGHSSDGAIQISPIFQYRCGKSGPEWVRGSGVTSYKDILERCGIRLPLSATPITLDPEEVYLRYAEKR